MRINFTFGIATMCGVLACLSFHTLEAQVVTNQPALDKTFSLFRQNESASYARATFNWPPRKTGPWSLRASTENMPYCRA